MPYNLFLELATAKYTDKINRLLTTNSILSPGTPLQSKVFKVWDAANQTRFEIRHFPNSARRNYTCFQMSHFCVKQQQMLIMFSVACPTNTATEYSLCNDNLLIWRTSAYLLPQEKQCFTDGISLQFTYKWNPRLKSYMNELRPQVCLIHYFIHGICQILMYINLCF